MITTLVPSCPLIGGDGGDRAVCQLGPPVGQRHRGPSLGGNQHIASTALPRRHAMTTTIAVSDGPAPILLTGIASHGHAKSCCRHRAS